MGEKEKKNPQWSKSPNFFFVEYIQKCPNVPLFVVRHITFCKYLDRWKGAYKLTFCKYISIYFFKFPNTTNLPQILLVFTNNEIWTNFSKVEIFAKQLSWKFLIRSVLPWKLHSWSIFYLPGCINQGSFKASKPRSCLWGIKTNSYLYWTAIWRCIL